jgi:CheY-like chemotaxis protein
MDGHEALQFLAEAEFIPDIILLDVMMPGINGYEVRIRTNHF